MIVGALTGAPGAVVDVIMDPRVDQEATNIYQRIDKENANKAVEEDQQKQLSEIRQAFNDRLQQLRLKKEEVQLNQAELKLEQDIEQFQRNREKADLDKESTNIRLIEQMTKIRERIQKMDEQTRDRPMSELKEAASSERLAKEKANSS